MTKQLDNLKQRVEKLESYLSEIMSFDTNELNNVYNDFVDRKLAPSSKRPTKTYYWIVDNPSVKGIPGVKLKHNHTVVSIDSYVTAATSATFNIEERSTIGSAGTDILSSDQVATVTGATDTSFANKALDDGNWLWLDISAVSGTPTTLIVVITCTINN